MAEKSSRVLRVEAWVQAGLGHGYSDLTRDGMTAVLLIALYVNGDDVRRLYARPNLL